MSMQFKAFLLSLLIHGSIISMILGSSVCLPKVKPPILMDFEMETQRGEPSSPPVPVARRRPEAKKMIRAALEKKNERPREKPVEIPIDEIQRVAPGPVETMISMAADKPDSARGISNNASGVAGFGLGPGGSSGKGTGPSVETARSRYLKEHFAYIRDKILKNVSYPPVAVRMGWQGRVSVCFIICLDGEVKDIVISRSSGIKALDDNAVETIHNSAPFPRPPVEAQLIIPITYRLK